MSGAESVRQVRGTITDELTRFRPLPCTLEFRAVGCHALATVWPDLGPGVPRPTLAHRETWAGRFWFRSDDGHVDARSDALNAVLGVRFIVPLLAVFPPLAAEAPETGAEIRAR